jgi:probable addiction module antidote protein
MAVETSPWDAVEYFDSDQAILGYLDAVLEDGDSELISVALDDVARAKGFGCSSVARRTDIASVTGLLKRLGFELTIRAA